MAEKALVGQVNDVLAFIEKMPLTSFQGDLAGALTALPEVDKALRKVRGRWLNALMAGAVQKELPLK